SDYGSHGKLRSKNTLRLQQHPQYSSGDFMQRISLLLTGTLLAAFCFPAIADDTADLIAQDKAWGAAGTKGDKDAVAKFLADKAVAVDETGVMNKQAQGADTEPAPAPRRHSIRADRL